MMSKTKPSDVIPLGGGSFEVEFVDYSENDVPGFKPGMNGRDYMIFVSHAARCHDDLLKACKLALEIRQLSYNVDANPKIDILERKRMARKLIKIENEIESAIAKAKGGAQ